MPRLVAADRRAHRGDARVLALEPCARRRWARARERAPRRGPTWRSRRRRRARAGTRERRARARSRCLETENPASDGGRRSGLSSTEASTVTLCFASSSRTMRVDRAAFCASLELRHHLAHHRADVRRAAGDCRDAPRRECSSSLTAPEDTSRAARLQPAPMAARSARPPLSYISIDSRRRLMPLAEHLDHVFVGQIALELDLAILARRR